MTVTDFTSYPEAQGAPRSARPYLVASGLILFVVTVSATLWFWRHPQAFVEQGDLVDMYNQVGTTALVGVTQPRHGMDPAELTLHAVEPQIVEGDATLEVLVCHARPGDDRIGAVRGSVDRYCASHETPNGAALDPDDQLVLRVRSEEPDRLVIEGVKVTYSHGWQRGSQLTGSTVEVRFGTETVREHVNSHKRP